MKTLRAALSGFFFLSYGLAALPAAPLLMIPGWTPRGVRRAIRWFYKIFVFFAHVTRLYRVSFDESTRRALTNCRGRLIVANHVSLIDICILLAHLPDSTGLAKAQAKKNPFLGPVIRKMLITNDENPEVTIAKVKALLAEGVNVIVFPQGTRGGTSLKRGAARLALAAEAPISAFRLSYDPVVLAKNQPWWDMGGKEIVINLEYKGEILPSGQSTHQAAVELTNDIDRLIGPIH